MKTFPLVLAALVFMAAPVEAKRLHPEKYYQEKFCQERGGVTEYVLPDRKRVDCLTDDVAFEIDFADKAPQCIGQALMYAAATGRDPGCVLIIEDQEKGERHLVDLLEATHRSVYRWQVWVTGPGHDGKN